MRFFEILSGLASICGTVSAQYTASKYYDKTSGITYSSITLPNGVSYRVALPVSSNTSEAILQVVVPNKFNWCGMAWGGHMTNNPLSVHWNTKAKTGQKAIVSSRMAFGYYATPGTYEGATYTYLKGTTSNTTHWQVTSRCQGCTRWSTSDGDVNLDTMTETQFAYACSSVAPDTPTSNTSTFNVHEQYGIWTHDLTIARNASFASFVTNNPYTGTKRDVKEEEYLERRWYA
ncbi:CBD9-like protein [Lindgomyces ingoldianus]|uniref:CBD9-like protein n=1 Tax=Lindgomyces ingoldianus TaxID=673940 RepID=A0ACB6RH33_9PLEO|nr:CBD9-like protein [Lindgomyces ingoldianus]KAF2477650.1 CBD9-like protein [Lindgomyces ingoldianus]